MKLKELCTARGISQLKLSMDLNLNQNSISRHENGQREAGYDTLISIADYFNVSIDYLLERTDDPTFIKTSIKK
ncbi:MAG: helix-turn-helix domain-containing protein [Clostridia bacterium]|nr:helix-turn-helix domain-containing protein [Clostridia bacterium]